jgi:hypothetical protein
VRPGVKIFLLMLGSAVFGALMVVAAFYGYLYWQFSQSTGGEVRIPPRHEKTVSAAPPIVDRERFYGSQAMMSGEFAPSMRQTVLAGGPGAIAGSVVSGGKPLQGLKLRLALNGAVMSQWATTGADGRYSVMLPHGKYRVDGYELDSSSAQSVLAGKTDGPRQNLHGREAIDVAEGKPGQGIDFAFVDPVKKLGPTGDIKLGQPVIVSWKAYPGASAYRVQLVERKEPRDFESHRQVFEWRERPTVAGTSVNLADYSAVLKKDHHYSVEIEALDEQKRAMAQTARSVDRMDFRVVE